jgi:hypothetical protein
MGATLEERKIHERLLAKDPTGPADAVKILLPCLVKKIRKQLSANADRETIEECAIKALLSYVQDPETYDPEAATLLGFLSLVGKRDYLNWLRKEDRHQRGRVALDSVENDESEGNYQLRSGMIPDREERIDIIRKAHVYAAALWEELPDEIDRGILRLILDGEKRTEAFARTMGLPPGHIQNPARVKRAKDRILKRLQRMRGRVDAE